MSSPIYDSNNDPVAAATALLNYNQPTSFQQGMEQAEYYGFQSPPPPPPYQGFDSIAMNQPQGNTYTHHFTPPHSNRSSMYSQYSVPMSPTFSNTLNDVSPYMQQQNYMDYADSIYNLSSPVDMSIMNWTSSAHDELYGTQANFVPKLGDNGIITTTSNKYHAPNFYDPAESDFITNAAPDLYYYPNATETRYNY